MLKHDEAIELRNCIQQVQAETGDWRVALERALELAGMVVADTAPDPAAAVDYSPCIEGSITANGRRTEFLIPLDRDDIGYSQWGADTITLGERVDLLEAVSLAGKEWALDNLDREEDGDD